MMETKTVLIVNGDPETTHRISELLKPSCTPRCATTGEKALQIASSPPFPDLILLDSQLSGSSAGDVCKRLKHDEATRTIPLLLLTDPHGDPSTEQAMEMGAADCIAKPITPSTLLTRVHTHLKLQETNRHLEELAATLDAIFFAMGSLAETRTHETGNHVRRTALFVKILAEEMAKSPRFQEALTPEWIALIFRAAPLHDLGKTGVPDAILLKPGKLTDDEFEVVKKHTLYGRDAILSAERQLKVTAPLLEMARIIACSHHERWDGWGYPEGLRGEEIPLPARLMMVADVYDALVTYRIYKPAFSHEIAVEIIKAGRGSQFDPDVVDAFLTLEASFRHISLELSDFEHERMAL